MSFRGMDLDQVEALTNQLATQAALINGVVATVDGAIAALTRVWFGDDLDVFHNGWAGTQKAQAHNAAVDVHAVVATLRTEIAQQRHVSGDGSSSGHAGPGKGRDATPHVVHRDTGKLEGEVKVPVVGGNVDAKAHIGYKVEELSDGSYVVTLDDGRGVGAGVGKHGGGVTASADTYLNGGEERVYHLPKGTSIEDFLHRALLAEGAKNVASNLPLAGQLAGDNAFNAVMADFEKNLQSDVRSAGIDGRVEGSMDDGAGSGGGGQTGRGVSIGYDTVKHEVVASVDADISGHGGLQGVGIAGAGQVHGDAIWDSHGQLQELTLRGDVAAQAGGAYEGDVSGSGEVGVRHGFEIKLDMTDPHVHDMASRYIEAVRTGDIATAAQDLRDLATDSKVTMTTELFRTETGGFDEVVAKGTITHESGDVAQS